MESGLRSSCVSRSRTLEQSDIVAHHAQPNVMTESKEGAQLFLFGVHHAFRYGNSWSQSGQCAGSLTAQDPAWNRLQLT